MYIKRLQIFNDLRPEHGPKAVEGSHRVPIPGRIDTLGIKQAICQAFGRLWLSTPELPTLPLSGRQGVSGERSDFMVACPLQGLVRRGRISTGIAYGPTPHLQSSSYLRIISHTRAQLQTKGHDHLQDGVKARTARSR